MHICPACRAESGAAWTGVLFTLCPRCARLHRLGIHAIEPPRRRARRELRRAIARRAAWTVAFIRRELYLLWLWLTRPAAL